MVAPSRRAIAIRSCSLLSLRPNVGSGSGVSHALAPGEDVARRRLFSRSQVIRLKSSSCCRLQMGMSQAFWKLEDSVGRGTPGHLFSHLSIAFSRSEVTMSWPRISDIAFATLQREAMKAGKAMSVACRRPRPPRLRGRKDCWYESGDKEQFRMCSMDSL